MYVNTVCLYLNAGCTRQALGIADHAHVICVLLQVSIGGGAAVETWQAVLLCLHTAADVAAGEGLVTHRDRPLLALWVRADGADGKETCVADIATEPAGTLAPTCVCVYVCMSVWVYECMSMCACVCEYVWMCACVCEYVCMCVHACVHT